MKEKISKLVNVYKKYGFIGFCKKLRAYIIANYLDKISFKTIFNKKKYTKVEVDIQAKHYQEKLEKEIKNLKQKIEKLQNDKQNYEESIEGILELSANLEKELQEIDITYATEKQKVISINENIEKLEKRLNRLKEEQASLEKQKEEKRE